MPIGELMDAAKTQLGIERDYDLAPYLEVSQAAVSKWRTGETKPSLPNAVKLAKLAGLDPLAVIGKFYLTEANTPIP